MRSGYSERHGMYRVDRTSFTRAAKRSAWFYADLIRENGFKGVKGQCPYRPDRDRLLYNGFPEGEASHNSMLIVVIHLSDCSAATELGWFV